MFIQVPKLPERKPESLGFDKPSFVYDHSDDQVERDTILLNYCIDDIENLTKVILTSCQGYDSDEQDLRESRTAASGSPGSMVRLVEDYKASEFISTFQKFKLAFNLLVTTHTLCHYQVSDLTVPRAACTRRCVIPRPPS